MGKHKQNGNQTYADRTQHVHREITVEEHLLPQNEMAAPLHEHAQQQQAERQLTPYERFLQSIKPLPPTPAAGAPSPQEESVSRKERNRRKNQYKELGKEGRLLQADEVQALPLFRSKELRKEWAKETLPHSQLTREETLKQVLNDGDYSNFENLDLVMRNLVASKALSQFIRDYGITERSHAPTICSDIQRSGEGVSALLNPALRLGLSLAQRSDGFTSGMKKFFRELDEAMSTAVMVSTLTHVADRGKVKTYFVGKGCADADGNTDRAIEANKAQQIQIAKRLLLMQLSNFEKITTVGEHDVRHEKWDKSMAVALSHCSRVVLTLPKQDQSLSREEAQKRMWKAILTTGGENPAEDNSRASSTHSIERRKVKDGNSVTKEKKVLFNLTGQRGMNCAIGGLGNAGISGKTLCNDGSCGHFYSMYKQADADHYGAMLMGLESDATAVTNQMGHTHDWHATAEKASSLGAQRTDEVGNKYGGRQCDLSELSAESIAIWMETLENAMRHWQSQDGGMSSPEAVEAMQMLSGKQLDEWGRNNLLHLLRNATGQLDR